MDFLSDTLKPYKTEIGALASLVTILQFFSGIPICLSIRKQNSTKGFSVIPFVGGAVFSILGLRFGTIVRDEAMIKVNLLGLAMNIIYVCFFYIYTSGKNKSQVWSKIGISGAFAIGCISYSQYEDTRVIEFRFGMIMTAFLLVLIGSPFLGLGEIIRTKSSQSLPFPIIASGTVVSILWLLYGLCLNNVVIVIQNLIAVTLSSIQLMLFVIYPSKTIPSKNKKSKKAN